MFENSKYIRLHKKEGFSAGIVRLSASKSESNRALIIDALTGNHCQLHNLSDARDTKIMKDLLNSAEYELDVMDAGTTMRFLTAYFAVKNIPKCLGGTARMNQRPIKILVDALRELGAEINYLGNEGFPPIETGMFSQQMTNHLKIRGDVSSQYISALLMIAPKLKNGLTIELIGTIGSWPYIKMTLGLMEHFGVTSRIWNNQITVEHQHYQPADYEIESDWSGASYWYSLVALADELEIFLPGLKKKSLQGDHIISEMMENLGVNTHFEKDGVSLRKAENWEQQATFDFKDCPDLAQTIAVVCAVKGIRCTMTGLESLRIKETDRILALQEQLAKIGASLNEERSGVWQVHPVRKKSEIPAEVTIETYDDHRMAMAFTPLVAITNLIVESPQVVNKSYPAFWQELISLGVKIDVI